jgi:cyclin B
MKLLVRGRLSYYEINEGTYRNIQMKKEDFNDENLPKDYEKIPRPFTPLRSRPPLKFIPLSKKFEKIQSAFEPRCLSPTTCEVCSIMLSSSLPTIPDYLQSQPELNYKMRAVLIDWLISVHEKFRLSQESLFHSVSLLDRFLSTRQVKRLYLQLVGVCSLMIACKYEEVHPPRCKDFLHITENAYSKSQLLAMEAEILSVLDFDLVRPTIYEFLKRWTSFLELSQTNYFLSCFLSELALVEYSMRRFSPQVVSLASVYLSCKILLVPVNLLFLMSFCEINEESLKTCSRDLLGLYLNVDRHPLTSVKMKYSKELYHQVSHIKSL